MGAFVVKTFEETIEGGATLVEVEVLSDTNDVKGVFSAAVTIEALSLELDAEEVKGMQDLFGEVLKAMKDGGA